MNTSRFLPLTAAIVVTICLGGCAARKLETTKTVYARARHFQQQGDEVASVLNWKKLVDLTSAEIEAGRFIQSNYFLRASSYVELGEWEKAAADLKQIQPETLRKEEYWIYPLYALLMGDYYSRSEMTAVAESFYQAVLGKSTYRSSPVYLLALERHVNNSIKAIEAAAATSQKDPAKYRMKEFESLTKEAQKYLEDFPFSGVAHYLVADLHAKTGSHAKSLEHYLAAFELGLPTNDLKRSAEFQFATLLSTVQIPAQLRSALLAKSLTLWSASNNQSALRAGENTYEWMQQNGLQPAADGLTGSMIRYLAFQTEDNWKLLAWEKR